MQTVTGSCEDEARDFLVEEKCKDKDGKCKLWEDSELRPNERDEARSDVLDRMKHERKKFDYFSECRGAYGDVQFLIYDVLRSVEGRRVWFCSLIGPVRILLGPEVDRGWVLVAVLSTRSFLVSFLGACFPCEFVVSRLRGKGCPFLG